MPSFVLGLDLRTVHHNNVPYFSLLDVVRALGIAHPKRLVEALDADEYTTLSAVTGDTADAETYLVTEPGLYRIALGIRRPRAALKRYICHEVLPSLRANRRYSMGRGVGVGPDLLNTMRAHLDATGVGVGQPSSAEEA